MTTHENAQYSQNSGLVPYKVIAHALFIALIGLIVYLYTTNVSAQTKTNDRQDSSIEQLTKNVLLLTQIVCQQKGSSCPSAITSSSR